MIMGSLYNGVICIQWTYLCIYSQQFDTSSQEALIVKYTKSSLLRLKASNGPYYDT